MTRARRKETLPRRPWTANDDALLRARFPLDVTRDVAKVLGRTASATAMRAAKLGLRKAAHHLESVRSGRFFRGQRRSPATEFKRGEAAWNKGTNFVAGGRSAETRWKAGRLPHNTLQIGSIRVSKDGYLEQKYAERPGNPSRRWRNFHVLVWEAAYGPVPEGHAVAFLPGRRSVIASDITLDALELVSRRELMARNTVHQLPPELREVVHLRGTLVRQIRKRQKSPTRQPK